MTTEQRNATIGVYIMAFVALIIIVFGMYFIDIKEKKIYMYKEAMRVQFDSLQKINYGYNR